MTFKHHHLKNVIVSMATLTFESSSLKRWFEVGFKEAGDRRESLRKYQCYTSITNYAEAKSQLHFPLRILG